MALQADEFYHPAKPETTGNTISYAYNPDGNSRGGRSGGAYYETELRQ